MYETDYEKIHELFECMQMQNVKVVEDELKRVIKGTFEPTMPTLYHNISNNPFWLLKQTSEQMRGPACQVSELVTKWVRIAAEQSLNSGKKVNPILNFQVNDKVRMVNRLMNRITSSLG